MQTDDNRTRPALDGLDAFFAEVLGEGDVVVDTPNPQWEPQLHPASI